MRFNDIYSPIYCEEFNLKKRKIEKLKRRSLKNLNNIENKKILEIGSGSGFDSIFLSERGTKQVIALDVQEHLVIKSNEIKNKIGYKNVDFLKTSFQEYLNSNENFDIIFAFESIHLQRLKENLPLILNRCKKFVWHHGNINIRNDLIFISWKERDLFDVLTEHDTNFCKINKYPFFNINIKHTKKIVFGTYISSFIEFKGYR